MINATPINTTAINTDESGLVPQEVIPSTTTTTFLWFTAEESGT
jgi:hypothetical protein